MKLSQIEIYQYSLNLHRPFIAGGQSLNEREGLLVRLVLPDGRSGVGDVAPLPGVSHETLKKALFQLKELRSFLFDQEVPEDLSAMRLLCAKKPFGALCPSVNFGIQSALINVLSVINHQTVVNMIQGKENDIPLAGLLQGTPEEIALETKRLLTLGCRTFKLKVGDRNIPLDVKKFYVVHDLLGDGQKIRLDANRSWQLQEAVVFCQNITHDRVEFIEEPNKDPRDLESFIAQTGFCVALDETLWEDDAMKYSVLPGVNFLVIKPTMIGGIFSSLDWINYARKNQKSCVISSSFESGVGVRMLALLASLTDSDAGLGTREWFKNDLLDPLWKENSYCVSLRNTGFQWDDINHSFLTVVN